MKPCLHSFKQRLMMNQKAFEAVKNSYCIGMSELDIKELILNTWDMNNMEFSGDIAADGRIEGDTTAGGSRMKAVIWKGLSIWCMCKC